MAHGEVCVEKLQDPFFTSFKAHTSTVKNILSSRIRGEKNEEQVVWVTCLRLLLGSGRYQLWNLESNSKACGLYHWRIRHWHILEETVNTQLGLLFNSLFAIGPFTCIYGKLVFIYFISIEWTPIGAHIKILKYFTVI